MLAHATVVSFALTHKLIVGKKRTHAMYIVSCCVNIHAILSACAATG